MQAAAQGAGRRPRGLTPTTGGVSMAKATKDITTPNQLPSKELHSKTRRGIRAAAGSARRPRPSPGTPIPTKNVQSSTYVYEIRVDGVVRYIGKGRNGRIYSHMIEAQRTASKPEVKIANLSPHFRKRLVSAIRRGAKSKKKLSLPISPTMRLMHSSGT